MNPILEPVRPVRGVRIKGEMYTADILGRLVDDITPFMESATVKYDWSELIPGKLDCSFRSGSGAIAIQQCLVPILTVEWFDIYDVFHRVSERLGLFFFLPPDRNITDTQDIGTIQGFDATWALNQLTLDQGYTINKDSAFYGDWAATLALGKIAVNMEFPKTDKRPNRKSSLYPNDRVLPAINDLYARAGYWPVVSLPNEIDGLITSPGKQELIGTQEPSRIILSEEFDIIGDVQLQPKREDFANQVFVASNSSDADPTMRDGYKATLTDINSPWSVQNLGYIVSRDVMDNKDEDFDAMRQRAINILEGASAMNTRMTVPVWPDPRFGPHEMWEMTIRQTNGAFVTKSKWMVENVTYGMTPDSAAQIVTVSQLSDLTTLVVF